jgi:signal transduction histidine kinase/DNA-binding response OmpR family regulator
MAALDPVPKTVNLLLVNDRPAQLLAWQSSLTGLDVNLVLAQSGVEALDQLLSHDFAAILLDVQMPTMDGFETAAMIRQRPRSQHVPILFVTAISTQDRDRTRGYALGAVDYIFTPIVPEILRAKVMVFAELHRQAQQLSRQAAQLADLNAVLATQLDEIRDLNLNLTQANTQLRTETGERRRAEAKLRRAHTKLEERVQKRTVELAQANTDLKHEIAERQQAERRLENQNQVTRLVADVPTLDEGIPKILAAIAQHLGWDFGELWIVDDAAGNLRRDYSWTDPRLGVGRVGRLAKKTGDRQERGEGFAGRVWASLKPQWSSDLAAEPNSVSAGYLAEAGLCAGVSLPVQSGGHFYGVNNLFRRTTRPFDPEMLQILESLAAQIGQFVERRRADDALRRSSDAERLAREAAEQNAERAAREGERLGRLQAATAALSQAVTPEEVAMVTVGQAALALNVHAGALFLLSEDGRELTLAKAVGYSEPALAAMRRMALTTLSPEADVIRNPELIWLENKAAFEARYAHLSEARSGFEALLAVPLEIEERVLGVVRLESMERRPFSMSDAELLTTLGRQCALALERTRLYAEAQVANAQLEARVASRTSQLQAANSELARSRADIRRLSIHLEGLREEERARIAREVHDELGGALTAIKMDVVRLGRGAAHATEAERTIIEGLLETIDASVMAVRRIATDLRPSLLDDFGLVAALEWQLQEFGKRADLSVDFQSNVDKLNLERDTTTAIFRVFQETLTNIARHAQASAIEVTLDAQSDVLILRVRDDGRGIADHELASSKSFGLVSMRERVELLSGGLDISGAPGQGTTVLVKIPLEPELKAQPLA